MIVCLCEGVSDREIKHLVEQGALTLKSIVLECGAGSHCGQCRKQIREILRREKPLDNTASCDIANAKVSQY